MPTRSGSIKLFKLFGITVYLHWAWFLVAVWAIQTNTNAGAPIGVSILTYLTLFLIVLLHEFGHQLACRSVGGQTHDIVLWPLGGVAYVTPPQRPGAMLWSIVAGPLVNVVLLGIFGGLLFFLGATGLADRMPNFFGYISIVVFINWILLKFNLLPIYPLDGGQILRSLLWFIFGKARSMMIASIVGFIGIAALIPYVISKNFVWYYALAAFAAFNCWIGFRQAQAMMKVAKAPRREGYRCPECKTAPPMGAFWRCGKCRQPFDTFETHAICPHCQTQYAATSCPECGALTPISAWENYGQSQPPQL